MRQTLTQIGWPQITGKPKTLLGYGITDQVVLANLGYANPPWILSLDWGKITGAPAFEPALGNPEGDGYLLSSTALGMRSWVPPPTSIYSEIWTWTTTTTDASQSGRIGVNVSTSWADVTVINVNDLTASGRDMSTAFAQLFTVGDTLLIQDTANAANFGKYTIALAGIDHTGWWSFAVTLVGSGGVFPDNNRSTTLALKTAGGTGGGGTAGAGVIGEVPSGAVNGSNTLFTLINSFIPATLIVYLNGLRQRPTTDFTIASATQFALTSAPIAGDSLLADYYETAPT